jgi:hypothetical protein
MVCDWDELMVTVFGFGAVVEREILTAWQTRQHICACISKPATAACTSELRACRGHTRPQLGPSAFVMDSISLLILQGVLVCESVILSD